VTETDAPVSEAVTETVAPVVTEAATPETVAAVDPEPATTEAITAAGPEVAETEAAAVDVEAATASAPVTLAAGPVTDFAVAGFVAADADDLAIEPESVFDPREPVQLSELEFVTFVEPSAPRGIGQRTVDGWVDIEFRVGTDGATRNIDVIGSSVSPRFEAAAVNAVERWRFEPYLNDGEPVAVYSAVRLRFTN